ncbi:MAG: adenosylcobinamide-GDP ribazoletransferase [Actinomycetota bacterium]|nr:MAG: adenosylcobinamide-GDP ribazoletransferase [Actinomycetota bacterium]
MKDDLLGAVSFLTIFGGGRQPKESSKYWFSLAGVVVAIISGLVWQLMGHSTARLLIASVVVLVMLIITGAIHIDGLADAADGLLAHLDARKRFEVMSSPEVGTFGIVAVVMAIALYVVSISVLRPNLLLLIGVFSLSRELAALVMESVPYAKSDGIVSAFSSGSGVLARAKLIIAGEMLLSTFLILVSLGVKGIVLPVVMLAVQIVIVLRAKSLIGGYTGDVLGASIVATETFALVAGALMQR